MPGHLKHGVLAETADSVRRCYAARMTSSHRHLHSTPCLDTWSAAVVCPYDAIAEYVIWRGSWQEVSVVLAEDFTAMLPISMFIS